jgi:hypothetical protein
MTMTTLISEQFTAANGTAITSLTPAVNVPGGSWAMLTGTAPQVQSNQLSSVSGTAVAAIESGQSDGTLSVRTAGSQVSGLMFRGVDANNYLFVRITMSTDRIRLWKIVSGSQSAITADTLISGVTIDDNYLLSVELNGTSIVVKIDGVTQLSITDSTLLTATKVGIYSAAGAGLNTWDDFLFEIPTPTDPITINNPTQYAIRQTSGSSAAVTVSGTYATGTPADIEVSDDGTNFETTGSSPAAGAFSKTITSFPNGESTVSARWTDTPANIDTVANVRVGHVLVVGGQSNSVLDGQYTNAGSYTGSPAASSFASGSWGNLPSAKSIWPELLSAIATHHGTPVGLVNGAVNSSGLVSGYWADGGTGYTNLVGAVSASQLNDANLVIFWQGEQDASEGRSQSAYSTAETTMAVGYADDMAGAPETMTVLIGEVNSATDAQVDTINAAKIANWAAGNTVVGWHQCDLDTSDGTHWKTDASRREIARRAFAAYLRWKGADVGHPQIVNAHVNGSDDTKIDLTFDRDLNTAVTNYTSTICTVDDVGSVTVSAVTRTGTRTVQVSCAESLSSSATITYGAGKTLQGATQVTAATYTLPVAINAVTDINLPAFPAFAVAMTVQSITVTSPISTDRRIVGLAENVTWTSQGTSGSVDILLSTDNGSTFPITIVSGTTDDGSYLWTPEASQIGAQCVIRVVDAADEDLFDDSAAFRVATTEPTGGGGSGEETAERQLLRQIAESIFSVIG